MIKKAIEYVIGLAEPHFTERDGYLYSDKPLERIDYNPKAAKIEMNTLSSLIDYIKANVDEMAGKNDHSCSESNKGADVFRT